MIQNVENLVFVLKYVVLLSKLVTWRSLDSIALESGTHLKSVTVDDDADPSATNIRVRRLFPEVWLFNSTTAGLVFRFQKKKSLSFYLKF